VVHDRTAFHGQLALAQVIATLDALVQLGHRPGLRAAVQDRLYKILEAALEIRRLPGGGVDRAAPLVVRVDECEVSYSLDLENEIIHVLAVEPGERPIRLAGKSTPM
jgi:hypothetical protein